MSIQLGGKKVKLWPSLKLHLLKNDKFEVQETQRLNYGCSISFKMKNAFFTLKELWTLQEMKLKMTLYK